MEENQIKNSNGVEYLNYPKKNTFSKWVILVLSFFILVFLLGYYFFFSAPLYFPEGSTLSVKYGESLKSISSDLKQNNLIRSELAFKFFIIIYGGEKHMAIGDYLFENKIPVFEVARRLAQRERNLAPVSVTIPEGYDVLEISNTFDSKLKNFDKENFLSEAMQYEGYLFPDTYFFFTSDTDKDVLSYMRENFDKKIKEVEPEINASGKTKKEIITMASIIEKEAKGDADRAVISGILWNRISKGMPLQVDAAPDTYKTKGLPIKPICNPGLEAIKSAINPVVSKYFYYLHDKEGLIHYARTFEEHKINKQKYLK